MAADNDGNRILGTAPPPANARLAYGPDPQQFGDLRRTKTDGAPLLMFIHGGYWRAPYDLTHAGHLCSALEAGGVATWNVEYRRVGNSGGGWPGTFEDIAAARQYLVASRRRFASEFRVDTSKIGVAGHSAGGALALWLASRDPSLSAATSLAGVIDLRRAWELHLSRDAVVDLLGGTPAHVAEHYAEADPMRLNVGTRQLLIHGSEDAIVPPEFSLRYAEVKRNETIDLELIKGAGHFDLVDPQSPYWARVQALLLGMLR
ncbi:MAG: prolyl oligopeptidase family serine peptidase [Acidobacteria bacterium]|nr:prolyl oligopeptidase family serine peptidase [Acidobacteriota bacterium]